MLIIVCYYCYMAYLLALTIIQVLIIILYLKVKTIRDERGEIIRILMFSSIVVLLVKYLVSMIDPHIDLLFTATSSLCLVSLSSLYIRNIVLEIRTSGYLMLLAFFPFLLFYVFFFLYNIFSDQIKEGMIYDYLDFFNQRSRTILFAVTLVYDVYILWPFRKNLAKLSCSIDGQLACSFILSKLIVLAVIIFNGIIFENGLFLKFPDGLYTFFVLFSILYYRYFKTVQLFFAYMFRFYGLKKSTRLEGSFKKDVDLIFYVTAIDQLMDQEKLFKNPELKLGDIAKFLPLSDRELKEITKVYLRGNFEYYLNSKRISYFMDKIGHADQDTAVINRLLFESGFKSEYEFHRIFHRVNGCSVWKYLERKNYTIGQTRVTSS